MLDFLKSRCITAVFTALASNRDDPEHSEVGVSSWMDGWIQLRNLEVGGVRRRALYIIKVRGMPHSNKIHGLQFTSAGLQLSDFGGLQV
jgi:circadian clock protein KaiC